MLRTTTLKFICYACLWIAFFFSYAYADEASTAATSDLAEPRPLHFGGCGGVYFLVEPGDFWVEVEKYDLNTRNRETFLRAVLAGPDRSVIGEETLPDDGQATGQGAGPIQRARLGAFVSRKGVYALNVTVTQDRYGEDIAWGFRTNCPRYLVETSRGHRDAPHEEPIVLLSPDVSGDICFMPERSTFTIEVSGLSATTEQLALHDGAGRCIATVQPDDTGVARHTVPAEVSRESVPWRLHLPSWQATVHIDGVTRWPEDSDFPNLSLWTPHATSWFPFHKNRWLLTPYSRKVYSNGATDEPVEFEAHNNDFAPRTFNLSVEFPGQPWEVEPSTRSVTVQPRSASTISLAYALPEDMDSSECHLRITPQDTPEFSTYVTLTVHRGDPPSMQPLDLPLTLSPYTHENEQFGYAPRYPTTNQVYFGINGRPFVLSDTSLLAWRDNRWTATSEALLPDNRSAPFRARSSKVAFDRNNGVYLIGETEGTTALLYSRDEGISLHACAIPGRGGLDIEQFSGHNIPDGPPPLLRYTLTQKDPHLIWRRLNDLDLFLPKPGADGAIVIGQPIPITRKCIGFSAHSGIPSSVVSRNGKVHVAWAEATAPEDDAPGVPTFVATYDRNSRTLGQPALVGYGPPANDVHNTPSITMDSQGFLHLLIGTHGRTFQYTRSLQPNDASAGWTEPEAIGPGLRQTYVGMVCDKADTLHVVFRLWVDDRNYFPAGHHATLAYMRKRPNEPWSMPQTLVVAPFSEYGIFYHRLTIDRHGRLFLSYDCWTTYWFYRSDHRGTRRALMMSPDGGDTWRLAALDDLSS